ncbi:MAG: tRNA preQ1(34) S-adenosylmethionine ribosyltransferase-isomerase QueA [Firmicutes bacterium GWF2_51_9]|nr:MAG: tRNA preQ1(34) S-adenosylmethionine ribosyltransferase-isomerase QueA [Firmicutes bacterium GWF2_51_9]OGS58036.1 MAG: tRNA preQ1(34) S-adenosylmethionine ribosyltransferase-isomerase QueA [Firmicutes bacterium GWE2_51_13]HAM63766.1 tRNA preQ1(34) S-adenosylmethionine ribosyltransferase-isomerase QueA [Erysipelotrichaceae bacterium]HBZ41326.1 tRNA preQ1(34) S-adenosylmethionine ribosyltransferase-isomerase QueA [Erysipelotrichaceae bacterium]
MRTQDFDFQLPPHLIAQTPLSDRSASRLLVVDRSTQSITHRHFYDLPEYLHAGDVLVLNETKVLPARLFGVKEETGAHVELLILKHENDEAECLVGNAKVVKVGTMITFGDGDLKAQCLQVLPEGLRIFKFIYTGIFYEILDRLGIMPLPPYIKEKLQDPDRYQTVYAKEKGSAAAPTAGLHFTPALLQTLEEKGIEIVKITLHVGLGTFRPVEVEDVTTHKMHEEMYTVSEEAAKRLNMAKKEGRRIISVGTTSTRTLETQLKKFDDFKAESSSTDIFIYPGFKFKAVDVQITNFHLPKSTLMMLVSAFATKDLIFKAYHEAIKEEYRFFSFGDSMLIL